VSVPLRLAEEARAEMIDLFPAGFEEREHEDSLELVAYTERADVTKLLERFGPIRILDVTPGWEDEWRRFHRPVRIGPLWVGPSWERPEDDAIAIVIDPGRAFGTGAHATTRLCLELLLGLEPASIVDVGCGSGVIAVAARKLGFEPVIALDSDTAAVEAARTNVAANRVDVDVQHADALADPLPAVEIAVVNIAREAVERMAMRFDGALVVSSGYLDRERPEPSGWRAAERRVAEGWAADLLVRR
jgi:ribosomal protein L11 methyltransferase